MKYVRMDVSLLETYLLLHLLKKLLQICVGIISGAEFDSTAEGLISFLQRVSKNVNIFGKEWLSFEMR